MSQNALFHDGVNADRTLARKLTTVAIGDKTLILALPRGGVPVGFEIAQRLKADLDVFFVRKLGVPGRQELAMGALASDGFRVLNKSLIEHLRISSTTINLVTAREQMEIERREQFYRDGRCALPIDGRSVILVDGGLATRTSVLAAAKAGTAREPKVLICAVSIASHSAYEEVRNHVEGIVCVQTPQPFFAVGEWYENFSRTSDEEGEEVA